MNQDGRDRLDEETDDREERLMAGLQRRDRLAEYGSVAPESVPWPLVDEEAHCG